MSFRLRAEIGLSVHDRIDPRQFLQHLGLIIWSPADIPGISPVCIAQLAEGDTYDWSGVTVREGDKTAIIVNSRQPATRQANTLMHEWAHLELRHKPNRVDRSENGLLLLSDYPVEMEEEADWLAGAVLLPREGLFHHRSRGKNAAAVASHFGVSVDLAKWRLRMTGVEKQIDRRF
jgi:Zn-dependent peptidase ImmA (M78 family)